MSARRIPVNAVALLAGRVVSAAVTLLVVAVASHRLDDVAFGIVVSTMAGGFVANSLVTFGTDTVVTRAVAAERDDAGQVAAASLKLQLLVASVLVLVSAAAVALGANVAILVQALALLPLTVVTVGGAMLRGRQRMDQLLVGSLAGAFAIVIALFVLFDRYSDAWVPIASVAAGALVTAVVLGVFARPVARPPGTGSLRALGIETAPFAGMVVLAAVGAQAGPLLVEFASDETAGGYGVAVRIAEAGRLVPAAAMGAFFPAMLSGLHRTKRYAQWMRWLVIYALAATAAVLVLAGPINRIVFDDQPGGSTLMRILALGLVVTVARLALSFELIAGGHEKSVFRSALLGAVVTVVGGLAVASPFGATGIAWAQIAGLVAATALLAAHRSPGAEAASLPTVGVGEVDVGDRHT